MRQTVKKQLKCVGMDREIDLVLMDIRMPELDGYNATKANKGHLTRMLLLLRKQLMHCKAKYKKRKDAGCNDFISKPH